MMINHERWEDNEWDYSPDAHEPMEMPQEWVYTDPNEGPEKRDPFAEIFTGENSLVGKISKGIADALDSVPSLEEWLKPVEEAAKNLIRPVENRVAQVEESQLSAEEQLALLEGVRGYGAAYQPYNYGGNVNNLRLDFTAPMGPMKGVSVNPYVKGLQIEEPGLWLVSVRATGRATAATNTIGEQDRTELTVQERPPGTPSREVAVMTGDGGTGRVSNTMTFPLVIEQAGTTIAVGAYSSRFRRWEGGKLYSNLSVTKLDSRLETPGDWTVPDA